MDEFNECCQGSLHKLRPRDVNEFLTILPVDVDLEDYANAISAPFPERQAHQSTFARDDRLNETFRPSEQLNISGSQVGHPHFILTRTQVKDHC
jgi:hypothetical protein